MRSKPFFSIIFVNYNGKQFINRNIASIYQSTYKIFEVLVVDNASTDGSIGSIPRKFLRKPEFTIVKLSKNTGPAGGLAEGARRARGKYLVFLGFDVELDSRYLSVAHAFLSRHPQVGAIHGVIYNLEKRRQVDYAGDYLDPFGFLAERTRHRKILTDLDIVVPVLSSNGASMMVNKKAYEAVGGMDMSYFYLLEETDLDWRLWLAGYQVLMVPHMTLYHAANTSLKNPRKYYSDFLIKYYGSRNYLQTLIINLGTNKLLAVLPLHIAAWLGMACMFLWRRKAHNAWFILRGLCWNVLHLSSLLKKRRKIQQSRIVSDDELTFLFSPRQPLAQYIDKIRSYLKD